jgi:hypothetical protein
MQWNESPDVIRQRIELEFLEAEKSKIEMSNTVFERLKSDMPELFNFIDKNITPIEKEFNYEKLEQNLRKPQEKI